MHMALRRSWILLLLGGLLVVLGGSASKSGAAPCNTVTSFSIALSLSPAYVDLSQQNHSFTATVTALDACSPAGVVTSYKGPATLTASGTPANGQPVTTEAAGIGTDTSVRFKQGVATLTVNPSSDALGVRLTVKDNSVSSIAGTSRSFDVFDQVAGCGANDCTGDVGNTKGPGGTSVSVNISVAGLGGFLGLSLGDSTGATCTDAPTGVAPFGQSYIIAPPSDLGANETYTATVRFNKKLVPGTGVANFVHCMATPSVDAQTGQTVLVYGVVPLCGNKTPVAKCIVEQHRNNAGDLVVTFLLGPGPSDPGGTGFS